MSETCLQYFQRRLTEGWKCVSLEGYNAVLLSPDGIRREIDLRNDVETLRPIGNVDCGFHVWCENCLIGGYNLIDDPGDYRSHDGDATYIRAEGTGSGAWCKSFRMSNLIESEVTINKITIHTVDKGFTWDHHTMIFTRHNNTDYMVDLTSWWEGPWTHHSLELTTNPGTGLPWRAAEINGLIVGLATYRRTGGGLGGAYTQMYVEVDSTPGVEPEVRTGIIPITVKPPGLYCEAELHLGPDPLTKVATSGRVSFISTGEVQEIRLPITMPLEAGTYHIYLDILIDLLTTTISAGDGGDGEASPF